MFLNLLSLRNLVIDSFWLATDNETVNKWNGFGLRWSLNMMNKWAVVKLMCIFKQTHMINTPKYTSLKVV